MAATKCLMRGLGEEKSTWGPSSRNHPSWKESQQQEHRQLSFVFIAREQRQLELSSGSPLPLVPDPRCEMAGATHLGWVFSP